ncbi:MAG: tripartite tricarboxylate transporter TctB family protein [Castellaniella sp.]|uniref:tripartite tricarboxylate transporter TctB family protein n=1 Tax=Castellaniella sp. TaxID=1955812 RepID=UPI003C742F92
MSDSLHAVQSRAWRRFAADLIVPALLCAYASHYYLSVARLPKPETNLLLIGPVYWILIVCSLMFVGLRLRDTVRMLAEVRKSRGSDAKEQAEQGPPLGKALAFIILTMACVWLIPILGFAVTIAAYTALMLLALGVNSLPLLLLVPTLLAGSLWVGMEWFLNLRVPTGWLF